VFCAPTERLYRAFLDAEAMAKWLPPYGFTCHVEHFDPKVGGKFRMSFKNFGTGSRHHFGGEYLELTPNELIRYTDRFDDPNLPGEIHVTIKFKAVAVGTEVHIEQTGIPAVIPVEACYLGWQESLMQLALLVQPNIPDGQ
ncbi:MAG: SRPBCC family protein, partial [Pirellulales bacterium]